MRPLALCTLALLPALLLADAAQVEPPAPPVLTKKDAADGWLALFDGETTFGWRIDGQAKVRKGVLILGGEKETKAAVTSEFSSFQLKLKIDVEGTNPVRISAGGVTGNYGPKEGPNLDMTVKGVPVTKSPVIVDVPAGSLVHVRTAVLKPLRLDDIFNGKDLTGWSVFNGDAKRQKSTFGVTKEGWLNVKDGPGDLQTKQTFDDFVLQLECLSNGKHLNSGVFFRALPGEYQQGYEAQIHNDFTKSPPRKYEVDRHDPKTHKLTGKAEVLSAAADFGTGAIYRRVPARKGVSKDGEWFALTLVARGRHLATWVNGVQQVDWTDQRPEDMNARKGYRAAAGCLSIQGHDPTTDLSFRNLRVVALPRPKR